MKKLMLMVLFGLLMPAIIYGQSSDRKIIKFKRIPFVSRMDTVIIDGGGGQILSQILNSEKNRDTIKELVQMGLYDYYPPEFDNHAGIQVKYDTSACIFVLLYIDNNTCRWTDQEILRSFPKGYRPARGLELLIYGQFLELQDNIFHIVALGESRVLPNDPKKRPLYLRRDRRYGWSNLSWEFCDRFDYHSAFLAIKKLSEKQLKELLKRLQEQQETRKKQRGKTPEYDPENAIG